MCNCYRQGFRVVKYKWSKSEGLIIVTIYCENCKENSVFGMPLTDSNLHALLNTDYYRLRQYLNC